jgi:hypothetical protein
MEEEAFTLADIKRVPLPEEPIYCIKVDSPDHQFLIGETGVPTHNTDDAKAQQALKGEAQSIIGSIARLGRAAGVHLCIATQRPDAKLLPGELKANLGMRLGCGHMQGYASAMTLESGSGSTTPASPKGRAVISIYGQEQRAQIYFAPQSWIDKWLDKRGMNQDGTPKATGPSAYIDHGLDGLKDGSNLDSLQGVDNSEYIARTQAEREKIAAEHARKMAEQGITSDMPGLPNGMLPPETAGSEDDHGLGFQEGLTRDEDEDYHIGRPELKGEKNSGDRAEDAWDDSMDLIAEAGHEDDADNDDSSADDHDDGSDLLVEDPDIDDRSAPSDDGSDSDDSIDMDDFTFTDDDDDK